MSSTFKNILSVVLLLCFGFFTLRMPSEKVCLDIQDQHVCLRVLREKIDQRRGFQLVEDIKPFEGLLYLLHGPQKPNFWMKDVVQHLDIVFVDDQGEIVDLVQTQPHHTDIIIPPINTIYALELPFGTAEQLKLMKGAKMSVDIFSNFHIAVSP